MRSAQYLFRIHLPVSIWGNCARAGDQFADIDKALDERTIGHNPERLNLMKGGIVYSNRVTTVSPTYAEEARSGGAAGYLRTLINEPRIAEKVQFRPVRTEISCLLAGSRAVLERFWHVVAPLANTSD
jgi:hypothetical protein